MRPAGRFPGVAGVAAIFVVSIAGVQAQPVPCAAPSITTISPDSVVEGVPFTLTVNGTGFIPASTISLNNAPLTTTFVNATQLTGVVPMGSTKAPGAGVTVQNCQGVPSAPVTLMVVRNTLNVSPASLTFNYTIGSNSSPAAQTVNITSGAGGINFTATASTFSGGNWLGVTPSGITPASLIASLTNFLSLPAGTYNGSIVIASNQAANSPVTIPVTLVITGITIDSLVPSSATAAGVDFTLTVTGNNFLSTSKVYWNDASLNTTYISPTQLNATVPAGLIAQPGVVRIYAGDPIPTDFGILGLSNVLVFTIDPPPMIVSLAPAAVTTCDAAFTLTVNGTGFRPGSIVKLNGSSLSTTFVSVTQLTATITAGMIAKAGSVLIAVINPGNATSNTVLLPIASCAVIDSLDPVAAIVGGPAFTLTVNGSGFAAESLVLWNGLPLLQRLSISATQITVAVPAGLIATAGCASITVDPGNPMSQPVSFCAIAPPSFFGPSLHGPAGPGDQPTFDFGINAPYPLEIDVTATLAFAPNAIAPVNDDPMIYLTADSTVTVTEPPPPAIRQIKFKIMPGDMTVPIMVQTGTVAGNITVDVLAQVAGSSNPYVSTVVIPIRRSEPVIRRSNLTFTPTGFEVAITAFSPERAMQKALFQFNTPAGSKNQFPDFSIDVGDVFTSWYSSITTKDPQANSALYGSQFTYKQAFTLKNAAAAIESVTVRLTNSSGTSAPSTTTRN